MFLVKRIITARYASVRYCIFILYSLKRNDEYVIVDDDTDFLLGQKDNFIHIDENTGITEKDIEKIIDILK